MQAVSHQRWAGMHKGSTLLVLGKLVHTSTHAWQCGGPVHTFTGGHLCQGTPQARLC